MFARSIVRHNLFLHRTMVIKAGEKLPSAIVQVKSVTDKQDIQELTKGKKTLLVGVVGAFTPTCDNQVPPFIQASAELKSKGIDQIGIITVNDSFVCTKWGESMKANEDVMMLADYQANFAKGTGLDLPAVADLLGNIRSTRFMMLVNDGTVEKVNVESDPSKVTCTDVDTAKSWL